MSPSHLSAVAAFILLRIAVCQCSLTFPEGRKLHYDLAHQGATLNNKPQAGRTALTEGSPNIGLDDKAVAKVSLPLPPDGYKQKLFEGRIAGGNVVNIEDFPWQVYLMSDEDVCGGSILSESWVLTAAHCLRPTVEAVRAGSNRWNSGGQVYEVAERIKHPRYSEGMEDCDIGVLKVARPFRFSRKIRPVPSLASRDPPAGTSVTVTGWGELTENGRYPDNLHQVTVSIVPRDKCKWMYNKVTTITERLLCAAAPGKDACHGDNGGPLVTTDSKQQVGVVSTGKGCARPEYPGVYVSVANFREWIRKKTGV